jgi:hypothetical protein
VLNIKLINYLEYKRNNINTVYRVRETTERVRERR